MGSISLQLCWEYSSDQVTCLLSSVTLCTAAVGKAWSLLGSPRNGQAALYLFKKHLLCRACIHSFSDCVGFLKTDEGSRWCVRSAPPLPRRQCLASHLVTTVQTWRYYIAYEYIWKLFQTANLVLVRVSCSWYTHFYPPIQEISRSVFNLYWRVANNHVLQLRSINVETGYNDIRLYDSSYITSDILCCQSIPLLKVTLHLSVRTTPVYNDTSYSALFMTSEPISTAFGINSKQTEVHSHLFLYKIVLLWGHFITKTHTHTHTALL